ncbi:MAG: DJ-1/PfpI family protein [Gammaproteobacteria bacterium]|nr:DJ-1/PfpI family protein [Gammaproteobacteria bacterium]MDH5692263.1 DJ-1/PfpI family protein [Gammaproteobacteria bacterium]
MARILIPLAQGCEELEAVTIIDLLRRAGCEVLTATLDQSEIVASRGTRLLADTHLDKIESNDFDMIVLPGGQPGTNKLNADPRIHRLLAEFSEADKFVTAICAAPKVLSDAGILDNRQATSFPGALDGTKGKNIKYKEESVVIDGKIVTSRGPGTAMDFALTLVELLKGPAVRQQVEGPLQRPAPG